MALTLLRKITPDGYQNLQFKTEQIHLELDGTDGEMSETLFAFVKIVDNELKGVSDETAYEVGASEEEFHKSLRSTAAEHAHLITSHCTHPEWNPKGYTKNLEDELLLENQKSDDNRK